MDQLFSKEVLATSSTFGIKSAKPGLDEEKRDAIIGNIIMTFLFWLINLNV